MVENGAVIGTGQLHWSVRGEVRSTIGVTVLRRGGAPVVRLQYTTTRRSGEKTDYDYTISLVSTRPNYGGQRWWWLCPLKRAGGSCSRRVGKLYLPSGASYFGCRHCYGLSYTSAQEHDPRVSRLVNDPIALYAAMRGALDDAGDTLGSTHNLLILIKAAFELERREGRRW